MQILHKCIGSDKIINIIYVYRGFPLCNFQVIEVGENRFLAFGGVTVKQSLMQILDAGVSALL